MTARRRTRCHAEGGMVTAELAVAVPAVVLVLACCLTGIVAAMDQLRCIDAARLASRAAARGDSQPDVRALALDAAPGGAQVTVHTWGGDAVVVVRARTGGWGGFVPSWTVTSTAVTPVESRPWPD